MNMYLAGSIFYYADELRNKEWAEKIRDAFPGVNLYSPIENTEINGAEGKKRCATSIDIVKADNARLDNTDVLIVCLDGDVIPSGSSTEIGVMYEKIRRGDHRYIVGITTDNRAAHKTISDAKVEAMKTIGETQVPYINLYTVGCCKLGGIVVDSIEAAIEYIKSIAHEFKQEFVD